MHDARHTAGTPLHLQGVPIAVISAWLGHSSPSFTMATYLRSPDGSLSAANQSLGSLVSFNDPRVDVTDSD
nr:tyrosine-type recombinase/integrase [Rhodococcus sp. (in: high G+C Gram-positive bacteria)]